MGVEAQRTPRQRSLCLRPIRVCTGAHALSSPKTAELRTVLPKTMPFVESRRGSSDIRLHIEAKNTVKILVLNCGSSSVKYQLIEMGDEQVICKGIVERIGTDDAIIRYQPAGRSEKRQVCPVADHSEAINSVISALMDPEIGAIKDKKEIAGIGHRIVQGADAFDRSVLVDGSVLEKIQDLAIFAPLHNTHNAKGIEVCMQVLPGTPQVAVFDTAFHQTMPPKSYLYAIPYPLYEKLRVRRYGFHGTSHRYVAHKTAELLERPIQELKIITCHLGNGASVAAVKQGQVLDTSMGFTPLAGLVMGTRSGDIDPSLVLYLMHAEGLAPQEMDDLLNKKSGMLGLTQVSHDMREIEEQIERGDKRCDLAMDIYCHRLQQYIGAYAAIMGGVDVIVFTGGVGENSDLVRRRTCRGLEFLGVILDDENNVLHTPAAQVRPQSPHISTGPTKVLVIPTNEELLIARDTKEILDNIWKSKR
jgi:acetate kinase